MNFLASQDCFLELHPINFSWMEYLVDYAGAYGSYLGLPGASSKHIVAWDMYLVTAVRSERRVDR